MSFSLKDVFKGQLNFTKNTFEKAAEYTPWLRQFTKGENFFESYKGAFESLSSDYKDCMNDETFIGRMLSHGEKPVEAFINAGKESLNSIFDLFKD